MARFLILFWVLRLAAVIAAAENPHITDLPAFGSLAPCAASGVSYVVEGLTGSKCPTDLAQLVSCACTKDSNSAVVLASITSNVKYYCASTATEDIASASAVFSGYCNQGGSVSAAPTTKASGSTVSQFITDLPAYMDLAPCAGSAISYAVQHLSASKCPAEASGLQSCACTKDQNSVAASQSINSQVKYYCGSTHTEDITSALGVFAGYCGLPSTSNFPSASNLPGRVSYYITDLPQFESLAPCAKSGVSYQVGALTRSICPIDPMALVSCACVKDNNSQGMSADLTSQVKAYCGSTASADITSALAVFDFYCSAGKGLVTPQGVTASVTGGRTATAGKTSGRSTATGGTAGSSDSDFNRTVSKAVPIAAIAGGVIGGLIFIAAALFLIFRYRRQRRRNQPSRPMNLNPNPGFQPQPQPPPPGYDYGKTELPDNQTTYIPPPAPIARKPTPLNPPVSPMSEKTHSYVGTQASEMPTPPAPVRAELHPDAAMTPNRAEMATPTGFPPQELPPNQQQYGHPSPNQYHEVPGMSATSGPIYEMDGRHGHA
ncbi:uncharacterized protein BP5553_05893 [Venustampulla echinocandica]|uniref:Extracellular membrane protein CFEM domain-containing protein n=1 Tax=Venustampulla echinocandica TaxID=2656787 RepID=A0A370TLY9_9HELO|nr:uncharacterized protein BP5553_05893 [Venustampulla echinocandica]RDL36541.1 hypothetical protein BP5553_05893 [Venustampulla echinocandica]